MKASPTLSSLKYLKAKYVFKRQIPLSMLEVSGASAPLIFFNIVQESFYDCAHLLFNFYTSNRFLTPMRASILFVNGCPGRKQYTIEALAQHIRAQPLWDVLDTCFGHQKEMSRP